MLIASEKVGIRCSYTSFLIIATTQADRCDHIQASGSSQVHKLPDDLEVLNQAEQIEKLEFLNEKAKSLTESALPKMKRN